MFLLGITAISGYLNYFTKALVNMQNKVKSSIKTNIFRKVDSRFGGEKNS